MKSQALEETLRVANLKAFREKAPADTERTQLALDSLDNQGVTPDMLKWFALKARERTATTSAR